jgi:hypothetical protein
MRIKSTHMLPKCKHCGKERGLHLARTFHCPLGRATRAGITAFHRSQVYEPKIVDKIRSKNVK